MEIRRVGDRGNRLFRTGQKMPARGGFFTAEMIHRSGFLGCRHFRRVTIIKAHENHFIVAARIERKHPQRTNHALFQLGAQHRASVVHKRQQHRFLLVEILSQLNALPGFIRKRSVQRHLRIQFRPESHILQNRGHAAGWLPHVIRRHLRKAPPACRQQHA